VGHLLVAHILPRAPLRLFEAPIFYPDAHTLAYSEHLLVPSLMGAPCCGWEPRRWSSPTC